MPSLRVRNKTVMRKFLHAYLITKFTRKQRNAAFYGRNVIFKCHYLLQYSVANIYRETLLTIKNILRITRVGYYFA